MPHGSPTTAGATGGVSSPLQYNAKLARPRPQARIVRSMTTVLTVNAGSSSLKLRLLGAGDEVVAEEELPAERGRAATEHVAEALARLGTADAVGHRIVHGGKRFTGPLRVAAGVVAVLKPLPPLAPLPQPAALEALAAVEAALPGVPAVACIDTAFHAHLPHAAATYALPREWRERHPLRRFGF